MKSDDSAKKSTLRDKLSRLFDDSMYLNNIHAVRKANLNFYTLFNCVMIFLLVLLYLSTLVSGYTRSMRMVYFSFIVCTVIELVLIRFNRFSTDFWITPACYFGIGKAYLFCLLSSVFYNRTGPAITVYVFLILIPVCFTLRIRVMVALQCAFTAAFSIFTVLLKSPEHVLSDTMNCLIFMFISVIMAGLSTKTRETNFDMYRKAAILEQRNKEIFDTSPCGMLELAFTGYRVEVLFANKTVIQMFGYSESDFWAKTDWDFSKVVYPEDIPVITGALRLPAIGLENTCDFRLKNESEGGYHWVSCKSLITRIEGERVIVLADFMDVDQKKRAESESEAKSRFLSRMSHEIRTPINAIMGMAELQRQELAETAPDLSVLGNYANETTEASKYLLTLVNDVLDTSRIESNNIELHGETVNAEKYLRSVINLVQPLADAKKIRFTCERETHLREAYYGDGVRLQQILINILNNAIKFTPEGGAVTLKARAAASTPKTTTLEFTVADTGIGMAKEFQTRLFEPFAQENAGTTSPFAGTGLGLNIAKALAQKMGGDITCTSEQGKGTAFVITVVVGNADPAAAAGECDSEVQKKTWDFGGVRILLCEDHPLNQKITKALLQRCHCRIEIAGNGADGVAMFDSHPAGYYSMILMDIRMPVMDGLQATAAIRALPRPDAAAIPIVAMSANAFTEDMKQSLAAGMNAHLAKPVDAALLYSTVARFTGTAEQPPKPAVLVVDDVEMNTAIIANVLKHDYEILTAENGEQALDLLAKNSAVVAVITDIQMPGMDGIELIRTIRANYRYDHIAILANTQYGSKAQADKLLAMGTDDFVYKPDSPNVLANRLRNVIARYKDLNADAE